MLSDDKVNIILDRILKDGVHDQRLQNDLLDHYCCFIEAEMDKQIDFEFAYNKAFQAITPGGMREIQEELFFLLTFKKQTNMKRIIYGCGFAAAFLITSGFLFRMMHWDGSLFFFISGFTALMITVLAIAGNALKYYKVNARSVNIRTLAGILSGFLIANGVLFKFNYFPGANIQIVIGIALFNLIFLPMLFLQLYKRSLGAKV